MFELSRYLERVGLSGTPSLAQLHRAHVTHIPFENLDPLVGNPVSLEPEVLARKMVDNRRGGYCFEQNLLFAQALQALGIPVELMLARVRNSGLITPPGPLAHLLLRVEYEGALWHADVGFGNGTLLEPIPFGAGGPYEQSGWNYRVTPEGELLVLEAAGEEGWREVYSFRPEPVPPIDLEVSSWFTSTNPRSPFVTRLLVTEHAEDGSRTTLSDFSGEMVLIAQTPTGSKREPVAREDVSALLQQRFGLREPELED